MVTLSLFEEFLGEQVKLSYQDGDQYKLAKGILESCEGGFLKITGRLGTLVINESNAIKMGITKNDE